MSQVDPRVGDCLANEDQILEQDVTASCEARPALARDLKRFPRQLFGTHLGDGQVGNIRQFLSAADSRPVEVVVELLHPDSAMCHSNENGGRYRKERFHLSEYDLEGLDVAAHFQEFFDDRGFGPL